jgi:hypothetical protein
VGGGSRINFRINTKVFAEGALWRILGPNSLPSTLQAVKKEAREVFGALNSPKIGNMQPCGDTTGPDFSLILH